MVKKGFDYKKLMVFGGIPTAVVAIISFVVLSSKTVTVYAELPKEVSQVKEEVSKVDKYIEKQQMQNELMEKILEKGNKKEPVLSPDGKFQLDEETQKWRKI